jgi:hypothetical protein
MSGWGCPHEEDGKCRRVSGEKCDPGMKGCTLSGRFIFTNSEKNISKRLKKEANSKADREKD